MYILNTLQFCKIYTLCADYYTRKSYICCVRYMRLLFCERSFLIVSNVFGQADPNSVRLDTMTAAGDRDQLRCGRRRTRSMSVQSGGAGGDDDDFLHRVSIAVGPSTVSVSGVGIGQTPTMSSGGSGGSADVVGQHQRPPPPRRRRRTSSSAHQNHEQRPLQKHHHHYRPPNRSSDSTTACSCCTSEDDSADDMTSS